MVLDISCNERTQEPEVIDIDDVDRTECIISDVPEYAEDIFKYLREAEVMCNIYFLLKDSLPKIVISKMFKSGNFAQFLLYKSWKE